MCCVQVAGAVGTAVGQISGEHQKIVSSSTDNADQLIIEQCVAKAKDNAIANGASSHSLTVVEKYIDSGKRVYVKVVGSPKEDFIDEVTDMQIDNDDLEVKPNHKIKAVDNPSWPFENEEIAKLDKQCGLPEPMISMFLLIIRIIWLLSCMAISGVHIAMKVILYR